MRIGLDASPLDQPWATGVEKAFLGLLQALAAQPGDHSFLLAAPRRPNLLPELKDPRFRFCELGGKRRVLWRERRVPAFAHRERLDLWHSPVQAIPLLLDRPKVATLHELSWLETDAAEDEGPRARRRLHARIVALAADRIVCVSDRTRRNFLRLHSKAAEKCRVIHHGVDPAFFRHAPDSEGLRRAYGISAERPYLLVIGRALRRKALPRAVEAFAELIQRTGDPYGLVLAGPPSALLEEAAEQAGRLGLGDRLHRTGYVEERDLPALYSGAAALLVPSESEGFGLPLLEAMACGTPVVANAAAAIPEVCGDAGILTDFSRPEQAAEAIGRALGAERAEWIAKGHARVAAFAPERLAQRMLDLWRSLAG